MFVLGRRILDESMSGEICDQKILAGSDGTCDENLDDNERSYDIYNPLGESKRSGDEDESNVIDGNIDGLTLDDSTLEAAEIVIPWMIWGSPLSDGTDTRTPFEGGKALDDRTLEDERRYDDDERIPVACNLFPLLVDNAHGPCGLGMTSVSKVLGHTILDDDDETLVGNTHDPCNREMTSVSNQMSCQRC